jgi:hypothetical protein
MAKTKVSEWDSTASGNTDINGININEGCPPSTINNAIRETMAQVKDLVDGSSGDSLTNSGTLTSSGTLAVTGNFTVDGNSGTSGQYLTSAGSGVTPTWTTLTTFVSGMIMLWSGSEASIPAGWLLCDGTSSTPDLRNTFVVGASAGTGDTTYPGLSVGATGGSATAVVVSHTHTTTVTDSGHAHGWSYSDRLLYNAGGGNPNTYPGGAANQTTSSAVTGISVTANSTGVSGTNANLPPYYALCYIMKS